MSLFQINSPIYRFMQKMTDILLLSFLWILFSLPIITVGAATTAANYVSLKLVRNEEGYITKMFVKAFKENFRQGTILGLVCMLFGYILWVDFNYCFHVAKEVPKLMLGFTVIGAVVYVCSFLYAFALTARYQNTISHMIKNSFILSIRYIFRTLIMLFMLVSVVLIGLYNTTTIFFLVVLGPGLLFFISSGYTLKMFHKAEDREKHYKENHNLSDKV